MMKVLIWNASPNKDGLTAACAEAFAKGAGEAGAEVVVVHLCDHEVRACKQCGNGWGVCRSESRCVIEDEFEALRQQVFAADAWVVANPVYFGDLAERVKSFMDRLRRCNVGSKESALRGKDFVGIAAAGGSGGGTTWCLEVMNRIASHTGLRVADLITVTRRSRIYKVPCIEAAGRALVEQKWEG